MTRTEFKEMLKILNPVMKRSDMLETNLPKAAVDTAVICFLSKEVSGKYANELRNQIINLYDFGHFDFDNE